MKKLLLTLLLSIAASLGCGNSGLQRSEIESLEQGLSIYSASTPFHFGADLDPTTSESSPTQYNNSIPCSYVDGPEGLKLLGENSDCLIPRARDVVLNVCYPTGYYPPAFWEQMLSDPAWVLKATLEPMGWNVDVNLNSCNANTVANKLKVLIKYAAVPGVSLANAENYIDSQPPLSLQYKSVITIDDSKIWQSPTNAQNWPTSEGIQFTKNVVIHELLHAVGLPHNRLASTQNYPGPLCPFAASSQCPAQYAAMLEWKDSQEQLCMAPNAGAGSTFKRNSYCLVASHHWTALQNFSID